MVCSIIIATCNRAPALQQTLRRLGEVSVPPGWDVELIIADNGSADDTAAVAANTRLQNMEVRYLFDGRKGKSNALNSSLAQARGEILLFTDDDVAPAKDWIERIGPPLLKGECDAIVGRIDLAPELSRPWMTPFHMVWMAVFHGKPLQLIGANMGLHRSVLERVPSFDIEIGPGASGFGEETLFSWQLEEAGLRLEYRPEAMMVHCPDLSRLTRSSWLSSARKHGVSTAYIMHHWSHQEIPSPELRCRYSALKLSLRRLFQPPPAPDSEGISPWEMSYVVELERCRQFLIERARPRNYSLRGLRRLCQLA
jgi:glucosyl-dolichyl phosphate glucuronosyltransferase